MGAMPSRRPSIERETTRRLRRLHRTIGTDLERLRLDAPASIAHVAEIAGVDRSFVGRIESGEVNPSLETLTALAIALGADLSVRIYAGAGPRLTDRHQARMVEAVLVLLAGMWTPHLEVPVSRPIRGVIDAAFLRTIDRVLVVAEAYSTISRLEQQMRWSAEKAAAVRSSALAIDDRWSISRLLILRSTKTNRDLARTFEASLRATYPAPAAAAVRSLVHGDPWPGDAIIWVRIEGETVELLAGPPRGVQVGR
jgi:transcriptional regulator with XRE-family HTH domain